MALSIDQSIERIMRLSRSFCGESNTDVSAQKEPFVVPQDAVGSLVVSNFRTAVGRLLMLERRDLRIGADAELILLDTARTINEGLHPVRRPFFRHWETPFSEHSRVSQIRHEYDHFCKRFADEWAFGFRDPVAFGAWTEWAANARGHFWYDGCGRITRAVAVSSLAREGLVYPCFESRKEYFALIREPLEQWTQTYRSRLAGM